MSNCYELGSVVFMLQGKSRLSGENNKDFSYRVIKEGIMSLDYAQVKKLVN